MAPSGRNRGRGRGRGRGGSLPIRNGDARMQRGQSQAQNNLPNPRQTEDDIRARSAFNEWRTLLFSDPSYENLVAHRKLARFWSSALGILNNNFREWHQWLAKDLVSDELNGLKYVRETLNFQAEDESAQLDVVQPFLEVITHHELLNSLSIEAHVGTIYSFICGSDGTRAVDFIKSTCQDLLILATGENNEKARDHSKQVLRLLIEVVEQLLQKEIKARLNDNLGEIFTLLDRVSVELNPDDPGKASSLVTPLRTYAGRCARLAKGQTESQPSVIPSRSSVVQSTFPLQLPQAGGRHDNDHGDITKIRLLPTTAEIMSNEAEYLPSTNWTMPHIFEDPVQRHLDTHFRLLRHDTFGPINKLLHGFIFNKCSLPWLRKQETRAHAYSGAHLNHIFADKRGLGINLSFLQPPELRKLPLLEQRKWWESSSRLDDGVLVAFVVSNNSETFVLFFIVAPQDARGNNSKADGKAADGKFGSKTHMLVPNQGLPQIAVKLLERTENETKLLLRLYDERAEGFLIEFPSIIPATFAPILRNLQTMIGMCKLAFSRWVLPRGQEEQQDLATVIPPPEYARTSGFKFQLATITTDGHPLELDPSSSLADHEELLRVLESRTGLDRGQCEGLTAALTREYALIQGPPGTGKSYVGVQLTRALLACKSKTSLGPIMVICYTNHALDQFLQHLMEVGIDKVIRIGGRSRVPELEGKNLRVVSRQGEQKTKLEQMIVGRAHGNLETYSDDLGSLLRHLHIRHKSKKRPDGNSLRHFLKKEHRSIHDQLFKADEEGFTTVGSDPLDAWVRQGLARQELDHVPSDASGDISQLIQRAEININSLTGTERQALTGALHREALDYYSAGISASLGQMEKEQQNIKNAHQDVDLRVLRQADIIGVTTTGLARDIEMLRLVGSKVVICEEAAEVLEAHLLSAMMPRVQHLIQIGDHQQLRPQITDYDLSLESSKGLPFQLNRSQFERRAVGESGMAPIPLAKLNIQRRARPEISRLYRIPLYPGLKDHENVLNHPNVVGMRKNLFWLEHDHQEDKAAGQNRSTSKTNKWEVDMVVPLVRHLVRQGMYSQSDIAVLTPYAGQLRNLRKALSSEFDIFVSDQDEEALAADSHGKSDSEEATPQTEWDKLFVRKSLAQTLRLATVDNFQGEEAKIIIISLVRGNPENKVGFLRTSNRINVLLSRARDGMYIIGNSNTYLAAGVQMWRDVYQLLEEQGNVGNKISLCCERHRETPIECATPEDFQIKSPEGGCALRCDKRLERCGHRCMAKCHSESMHKVWNCPQPCARIRQTCTHPCRNLCGQNCGPCLEPLDGIQLPCGHMMNKVPCYKTQDVQTLKCKTIVEKTVPGCNHKVRVKCSTNVESGAFHCPVPCEELLACGHGCTGDCGSCTTNGDQNGGAPNKKHAVCSAICQRPSSTCSHQCKRKCHGGDDCGPCRNKCEVRCPHSACGRKCSEPCTPCIEPCIWHCEHQGACPMPCAAPCERLPCNERCTKTLKCGHRCSSVCGEDCREGCCHQCRDKEDSVVDYIEFKTYAEIDVNETPVVVLSCGHIFTAESLDGHVGMHDVYLVNQNGQYTGVKDISSDLAKPVPGCPECRRPILQFSTKRYNRVINRAVMDETTKRLLAKGRIEIQALEAEFQRTEESLQKSRNGVIARNVTPAELSKVLQSRYDQSFKLINRAKALQNSTRTENQPSKKLGDAINQRKRLQGTKDQSHDHPSTQHVFAVEKDIFYGAAIIMYQMQDVKLRDTVSIKSRIRNVAKSEQAAETPFTKATRGALKTCAELIGESTADRFPRASVQLTLCYANMTKALEALVGGGGKVAELSDTARTLLDAARRLCKELRFDGAQKLGLAVEDSLRLFEDRYETVTAAELDDIKSAMVSGPGGIATHSGHWYKCQNGHPFAIGECGMPMELARCPECGANIGGQDHSAVAGVERASEME
ncbi:hypothetical protein PgNI_06085 [Pyricularia grisea]|uniref:RZ-type domain-containing protein n=1 Tax=Pyricularia grisea TaxID=148305 RepID=A0A6P8B500_PYRGI|nr:hypothetical protein PgNI_06085 [Pyricularia grisea]TLD10377.1 hypothetical protein PgNI_06085 [Pyricularia grisea]